MLAPAVLPSLILRPAACCLKSALHRCQPHMHCRPSALCYLMVRMYAAETSSANQRTLTQLIHMFRSSPHVFHTRLDFLYSFPKLSPTTFCKANFEQTRRRWPTGLLFRQSPSTNGQNCCLIVWCTEDGNHIARVGKVSEGHAKRAKMWRGCGDIGGCGKRGLAQEDNLHSRCNAAWTTSSADSARSFVRTSSASCSLFDSSQTLSP